LEHRPYGAGGALPRAAEQVRLVPQEETVVIGRERGGLPRSLRQLREGMVERSLPDESHLGPTTARVELRVLRPGRRAADLEPFRTNEEARNSRYRLGRRLEG